MTIFCKESIWPQDLSEGLPLHTVKSLPKVYETDEQQDIPFKALFQDVPHSKDMISESSTFPESCLLFSLLVVNCWFDFLKKKKTAEDGKERERKEYEMTQAVTYL